MKRRLPLIFVAVVTVICLVAVAVAAVASGVGGSPVAYRVNATKVSQATVDNELQWLAGNKQVKKNIEQQGGTTTDAAIASTFTASWLFQRIQADLFRQAARRQHAVVPAATLAKLRQQFAKRYPHAPSSALDVLVDGVAYPQALGLDTDAKVSTFFQTAIPRADVSVDPRYGSWNPRQGVCPPTGCAPTTAGG
jgi:hypothetical protein